VFPYHILIGNNMKYWPKIYIGHDNREDIAYEVCRHSLLTSSSLLLEEDIAPVKHQTLRNEGLFNRAWRIDEKGQYWDELDGKPFSTEFSFTRFLVPEMARRDGIKKGPVIFVDCDFDPSKAVQVVKFNFNPTSTIKMDNKIQSSYPMKLWSSLMMFNMGHPDNLKLTPEMVNSATGSFLHGFGWISSPDLIGEIPPQWNYVAGVTQGDEPAAIHYTEGGPWFSEYEECPFANEWYRALITYFDDLTTYLETCHSTIMDS
jgi:hypothetical protein